jgi:hypothetical protein
MNLHDDQGSSGEIMTRRYARAGGLALLFYVLLFEFLAGTRWTGFPRILLYIFPVAVVLVGLAAARSLLRRERSRWVRWPFRLFGWSCRVDPEEVASYPR